MKTKIKSLISGIIIGLLVGAIGMCAVFYATEGAGSVDWQAYIEGTVIPTVLSIAAAVGVGSMTFKPTIDKIVDLVKSAAEKFTQATEDVNNTAVSAAKGEAEAAKSLAKVAEFAEAVSDMKEALSLTQELMQSVRDEASAQSGDIKQMLRLGFGNMDELVKKGSAKRIMKVGEVKADSNLSTTSVDANLSSADTELASVSARTSLCDDFRLTDTVNS